MFLHSCTYNLRRLSHLIRYPYISHNPHHECHSSIPCTHSLPSKVNLACSRHSPFKSYNISHVPATFANKSIRTNDIIYNLDCEPFHLIPMIRVCSLQCRLGFATSITLFDELQVLFGTHLPNASVWN